MDMALLCKPEGATFSAVSSVVEGSALSISDGLVGMVGNLSSGLVLLLSVGVIIGKGMVEEVAEVVVSELSSERGPFDAASPRRRFSTRALLERLWIGLSASISNRRASYTEKNQVKQVTYLFPTQYSPCDSF